MFPDLPFLERIDAACGLRFRQGRNDFPYEHPVETLKARLAGGGVALTGLNNRPRGRLWAVGAAGA